MKIFILNYYFILISMKIWVTEMDNQTYAYIGKDGQIFEILKFVFKFI